METRPLDTFYVQTVCVDALVCHSEIVTSTAVIDTLELWFAKWHHGGGTLPVHTLECALALLLYLPHRPFGTWHAPLVMSAAPVQRPRYPVERWWPNLVGIWMRARLPNHGVMQPNMFLEEFNRDGLLLIDRMSAPTTAAPHTPQQQLGHLYMGLMASALQHMSTAHRDITPHTLLPGPRMWFSAWLSPSRSDANGSVDMSVESVNLMGPGLVSLMWTFTSDPRAEVVPDLLQELSEVGVLSKLTDALLVLHPVLAARYVGFFFFFL
jgi:hypothetical protein